MKPIVKEGDQVLFRVINHGVSDESDYDLIVKSKVTEVHDDVDEFWVSQEYELVSGSEKHFAEFKENYDFDLLVEMEEAVQKSIGEGTRGLFCIFKGLSEEDQPNECIEPSTFDAGEMVWCPFMSREPIKLSKIMTPVVVGSPFKFSVGTLIIDECGRMKADAVPIIFKISEENHTKIRLRYGISMRWIDKATAVENSAALKEKILSGEVSEDSVILVTKGLVDRAEAVLDASKENLKNILNQTSGVLCSPETAKDLLNNGFVTEVINF